MVFNDKSLPRQFVQHGATGIYFKVLTTGSIQQGDEVQLHYQHPAKLAVKTLFKAYFDKQFVHPLVVMQQAADIAELSDEWRQKVVARLNS